MINRKIAPKLHPIQNISFRNPEIFQLENGAKVFYIGETDDPAIRIDFMFDAGSLNTSKIISILTGDLLLSGTAKKTSDEIEEAIDRLGGYTEVGTTTERTRVSIYGLKEHIVSIAKILVDTLLNVTFDEKEIKQLIIEKRKKLEIQLQKVNIQAKRQFIQELFPNSPYGIVANLEDFDHIKREDIIDYHKNNYLNGLKYICIVGQLDNNQIESIKELGNRFDKNNIFSVDYDYEYTPNTIHIEKEGALQSAIRIGKVLFNKKHPDFKKFIVMNTILGGYFGSRLMTSIREEKGYTYGIGSSVVQFKETGYFYISSEVAKEFKDLTLEAIKEEITLLQTELVDEEELELVKNYLIGEILEQSDGQQAMMDRFNSVYLFDLTLEYYNELIQTVNEITAKEIREMAKKYLNWGSMTVVTVG